MSLRAWRFPLQTLRAWRFPLQLAVTVALVALLWRVTDGSELEARLEAAHLGWLAAGVVLVGLCVVLAALRWRYTAHQLGASLSKGVAVREFYMAVFLNQVLPGGMAGDAIRAWRHGKQRVDEGTTMGPAIRSVVIERMAGYLAQGPFMAASMALWPLLPGALPGLRIWAPLVGAIVLLSIVVVGVVLFVRGPAGSQLERFLADSRRALFSRRTIGPQLGFALGMYAFCLAIFYCAAHAVHAELSLFHLVALVPTVILSMSLPISVGGWGLREGTAVALWTMAGLPAEEALAASIVYGIANLLGSLPGAVMLLRPSAPRQ